MRKCVMYLVVTEKVQGNLVRNNNTEHYLIIYGICCENTTKYCAVVNYDDFVNNSKCVI